MEVHHHSHSSSLPAGKAGKKWTHYFWEFLMLFLAVFAGFLAENFREHQVEHRREKQYMISMLADFRTDTARLNNLLRFSEKSIQNYDSLRAGLKNQHWTDSIQYLYYYFLRTTYYDLFHPSRRTINQLESSGGMRLIRNQMVSDSITDYYIQAAAAVGQGDSWLRYFDQYHEIAFRVFDYSQIDTVFYNRVGILSNPHKYSLLVNDPGTIKVLYNKLFALRFILYSYTRFLEGTYEKAASTLAFVKKEYHLE